MSAAALHIRQLGFYYPGRTLFAGLDAEFAPGLHWLQGENGCGKSTLLKLIGAALEPHTGQMQLGTLMRSEALAWRRAVFLCQGEAPELPWLRASEWLELHLALYCQDATARQASAARLHAVLQQFALQPVLRQELASLSLGQHKKLQLALGFALPVQLLLLDEPLNALDAAARANCCALLQAGIPAELILLTSHVAPDLAWRGNWHLQQGRLSAVA